MEVAAVESEVGLAPAEMAEADRGAWTILGVLSVAVLASSVLHHGFPGVLNVPSNAGVPGADWLSLVLGDLITAAMAWLCFRHAAVRPGFYRAVLFLAGSFVFTGLEESLWILWGRFDPNLEGTYYFTKGALCFLETPVNACLGWFFLAYSSVYIAKRPYAMLVIAAMLGLAVVTPVAAQAPAAPSGQNTTTNMDILKDKLKADKKLIVAATLELTDAEAKGFWPIYDAYQADLWKINERLRKAIEGYAVDFNAGTLTDEKASALTAEALAIEEAEVAY